MKAKNSMTAKKRQDVARLAKALGELIPATSRGPFCFESIAKSRSSTRRFWKKGRNKEEMITNFFLGVYRYHPNLIYKIARENIEKGITRRHKNGNPVLRSEIKILDGILNDLGINMGKELKELDLPSKRPYIVPPPFEYQKMIGKISLEPDLQEKCRQLFLDGHINESIRKAFEIFESRIQNISKLEEIGTDLMMKAFNEDDPIIKIADTSTKKGKSFQQGYRFIAAGSMLFLKNKYGHGDEPQESYIDGFQMLLTANQLLREVNKVGRTVLC